MQVGNIFLFILTAVLISACSDGSSSNNLNDQNISPSESFTIDWCKLQDPTTMDAASNTEQLIYARLYITGLTDLSTLNDPHDQVIAQAGYGTSGSTPSTSEWTWFDGIPNDAWDSVTADEVQNDEYVATLTAPSVPSTYSYTFRFSGNNGATWTYCDTDGIDNGYDISLNGIMTVTSVLDGFGTISGQVNNISAIEINSSSPYSFRNTIDFADNPYDDTDFDLLSAGAQKIITDSGSSGSSTLTLAFSYDILYRTESAILLKSESEIIYQDPAGKTTDFLVEIDGRKVGVMTARAVSFPYTDPYTISAAQTLISNKLQDILDSTANVATEDIWNKQILHIFAYSAQHADLLETAWANANSALKSDTILIITVTEGDDGFLY